MAAHALIPIDRLIAPAGLALPVRVTPLLVLDAAARPGERDQAAVRGGAFNAPARQSSFSSGS